MCERYSTLPSIKAHGIGGETISNLIIRLKNADMRDGDIFVLETGTNDLLLPCLKGISRYWKSTIEAMERKGRIITKDITEFRHQFATLAAMFRGKKAIFTSIPCIGENTSSEVNDKVRAYNAVIAEACDHFGFKYADTFSEQEKEIVKAGLKNPRFIHANPLGMIIDVITTKAGFVSQMLSQKRNLAVTVDGVHLNRAGAIIFATKIRDKIKEFHSTNL